MHVRFFQGYFDAVDASIMNDWHTIGAQDLNTGSELVDDVIVGNVTMDLAILDPSRSSS